MQSVITINSNVYDDLIHQSATRCEDNSHQQLCVEMKDIAVDGRKVLI